MKSPLHDVCCACLPAAALASLAPLRVRAGVRVLVQGDRAWVFWDAPDEEVLYCLLAVSGVEMFAPQGGHWVSPGRHLPVFGIPSARQAQPLQNVLTPAPFVPRAAGNEPLTPVTITVVRDSKPRQASALSCSLAELGRWAESATSRQLAALQAARLGKRVLVRGERLPPLAEAYRYWGQTVLVPLGMRPQPDLAEAVLREVLELQQGEVALLEDDAVAVVGAEAFGQLSRAGIRLALREQPA